MISNHLSRKFAERRYHEKLESLPAPGTGAGFHTGMLGVATLGFFAGVSAPSIYAALRDKADEGTRVVPDGEIIATLKKAFGCAEPVNSKTRRTGLRKATRKSNSRPPILKRSAEEIKADQVAARLAIHRGRTVTEEDLIHRSPVKIPAIEGQHNKQAAVLLDSLYNPTDLIFIGERWNSWQPPQAKRWALTFALQDRHKWPFQFIVPNPFSGELGPKKDGALSYRADNCVPFGRFVVLEFDNLPLNEQLAVVAYLPMSVAVVVTSGGQSIHAWIHVSHLGADPRGLSISEWDEKVIKILKPSLTKLGADPSTFNRGRLSRLAGQYRSEKQAFQRLLYLNPKPSNLSIMQQELV